MYLELYSNPSKNPITYVVDLRFGTIRVVKRNRAHFYENSEYRSIYMTANLKRSVVNQLLKDGYTFEEVEYYDR